MDERDFRDERIDEPSEALPPSLRDLLREYNAPPPAPRDAMWARIEAARRAGGARDSANDLPLAAFLGDADVVPIERGRGRERRPLRWVAWSAGVAALLTLGIGIGRVWEHHAGPVATPLATGPTARPSADANDANDARASDTGTSEAASRGDERSAPTAPAAGQLAAAHGRGAGAIGNRNAGANPSASATGNAPSTQPSGVALVSTGAGMSAAYRLTLAQHLGQSEAFLTLFRASVRAGRTERLAGATAEQLLATNRLLLDSPAAANAHTRQLLEDLELVLAQIAQLGPRDRSEEIRLITDGLDQSDVLPRIRTVVPAGVGS